MRPRGCLTFLVVSAVIALGAYWLINHMPTPTPPSSPVVINNLPLASPVGAALANPVVALTAALTTKVVVTGDHIRRGGVDAGSDQIPETRSDRCSLSMGPFRAVGHQPVLRS